MQSSLPFDSLSAGDRIIVSFSRPDFLVIRWGTFTHFDNRGGTWFIEMRDKNTGKLFSLPTEKVERIERD